MRAANGDHDRCEAASGTKGADHGIISVSKQEEEWLIQRTERKSNMMTDSKLLLLVTQKTELVELISFLAFFSLPFPLLGFTKILMPGKEKMFGKLQGCFWMMAVIYTVNYMTDLIPVTAVIVAEHFFMVVTIILVLYYGAYHIREHKNGKILRVMLGYITFSLSLHDALPISVFSVFLHLLSFTKGIR